MPLVQALILLADVHLPARWQTARLQQELAGAGVVPQCVCTVVGGSWFVSDVCAAALEAECYPGSKDHKVTLQNEGRNKHVTGVEGGRQMNPVMSCLANAWLSSPQLGFQDQQAKGSLIALPLQPCSKNHIPTLSVTPSTH